MINKHIALLYAFALFICSSFQLLNLFDPTNSFVFVTLSPDGNSANINLVVKQSDKRVIASSANDHLSLSLPLFGKSLKMAFLYHIAARSPNNSAAQDDSHNVHLSLFSASVNLKQHKNDGLIEYALIAGGNSGGEWKSVLKWPKSGKVSDEIPLRVCVFGDYRADVMYTRELNLSDYVVRSECHLNLFIGKISWEQRNCANCSATVSPNSSVIHEDVGLSFSPFSMLHDNAMFGQAIIFANVPSLFGAVGHNLNETSFFDCTEIDGVAFIQTTVEVSTVARLEGNHQTEQFKYVERFFRESMLNELECKLQELHHRPRRPWIIVYLTHPSLINEKLTEVLSLRDNDRFFEILNRYKIDLLLSCGVEGMAKSLTERRLNNPNEQLSPYLNTTMATCLNSKNCQYLVLEIKSNEANYWYKSGEGISLKEGKFQKSTVRADACISDKIPSITGGNVTKARN